MSISRLLTSIRTSSGRRGMSGQLNLEPRSLVPLATVALRSLRVVRNVTRRRAGLPRDAGDLAHQTWRASRRRSLNDLKGARGYPELGAAGLRHQPRKGSGGHPVSIPDVAGLAAGLLPPLPADPETIDHAVDPAAGRQQALVALPWAASSVPGNGFEGTLTKGFGIPLCAAAAHHVCALLWLGGKVEPPAFPWLRKKACRTASSGQGVLGGSGCELSGLAWQG